MNVRQHIQLKADKAFEEFQRVSGFLEGLPGDLGVLEVDSLFVLGTDWLCLQDSTHKELGVRLATITDQTSCFRSYGSTRTATFDNVGPYRRLDFDRPRKGCRKVRVLQLPKEVVLEICGNLPEGYELLEELDVPA